MGGLLACPFCGGDRIAEVFVRDGRSVGCTECKAFVTAYQPDASAKARQAWNTRHPTPSKPKQVEAAQS